MDSLFQLFLKGRRNAKSGLSAILLPLVLILVLTAIVVTLFVISFKNPTASSSAENHLAYISYTSGDVRVSNGISDMPASGETYITGSARTLLKTGNGFAILKMNDGSDVVLDANSTIEFNRKEENSPEKFYIFNLVKGKALVINGADSQSATQVFVGGDNTLRVYRATTGLQVQASGEARERVDCLVGKCLVNGVYLLLPGQTAQIGAGGALRVSGEISYEGWQSLIDAGQPHLPSVKLLASILPTPTKRISRTPFQIETRRPLPVTGEDTATPMPSATLTPLPTATETPTSTRTTAPVSVPSRTPTPIRPRPTATPQGPAPSATLPLAPGTPFASYTPHIPPSQTPIRTPFATITLNPSPTSAPPPTATSTPQPTKAPTATPLPTSPPPPSSTPTEVVPPTSTQAPSPAPAPSSIPTEGSTRQPPPPPISGTPPSSTLAPAFSPLLR